MVVMEVVVVKIAPNLFKGTCVVTYNVKIGMVCFTSLRSTKRLSITPHTDRKASTFFSNWGTVLSTAK